jgi:hypothetical protein
MIQNYILVLFKNKKKRKIIKRYYTEKNAKKQFDTLIKKNSEIIFEKKIENTDEVVFHLGLLTNKIKTQNTLVLIDDLGRNEIAKLDDKNYVFIDIKNYNIEEKLYDYQKKIKITFNEFIKFYCKNTNLKNIFSINNKVCVQEDENIFLFSFKNINESNRFLNLLESFFFNNNRNDSIFVRDVSITQRKWIYDMLEKHGFNKKNLYRQKTTFLKK